MTWMLASFILSAVAAGTVEYTLPNPWLSKPLAPLPGTPIAAVAVWERRDPWVASALGATVPLALFGVGRMGWDLTSSSSPSAAGTGAAIAGIAGGSLLFASLPAYGYAGDFERARWSTGLATASLLALTLGGLFFGPTIHPIAEGTPNEFGVLIGRGTAYDSAFRGAAEGYSLAITAIAIGTAVDAYFAAERMNQAHGK